MIPLTINLIYNAALLLAMMVVLDLVTSAKTADGRYERQVLAGLILGGLCIGIMSTAFPVETGIFFDTRSVLLSISGLFLGTVPTAIAMVIAAIYRYGQGGVGTWTGILLILASGGIGIFWRHYGKRRREDISMRQLYGFGLVVHLVMLILMLTLPWEAALRVLRAISLPVLLIFPIATIALGWLLANRIKRENAASAVAASEARYRGLFEAANVGKSVTQPTGEIDVNQAFCDMLGYRAEELRGKTWQALTPPEDVPEIERRIAPLLDGQKESTRFEKRYVRKDGGTVWTDISVSLLRDNRRRPLHFITTVVDITERKKAEQALSHSHDLMKYIIEHSQRPIAVFDAALRYVYVSKRYLEDYRVKDPDIFGKHHYEVFPDIPEKWREVHQKGLQGILSRAEEDVFHRNDGTFDWTRWECRPWYEADGSIGGIILYTEIISDRKRKEEEIIKLNQRLKMLIESIQQLSAAKSLDSVQEIVAKSARKLIGADGATIVLRDEDYCSYVNEDAIQPLWKGKKFPINTCISGWVMENGKAVVIADVYADARIPEDIYSPTFVKSLAMVPVSTSESVGAIGTYWKDSHTPTETELQLMQTLADATARAIENISLCAELEARVESRTAQLEASNKELEAFSYSVSHDLRAPLRHINGYVDLLNQRHGDALPEKARHYLDTVSTASRQMGSLIDDLLQYSRIGQTEVRKTQLDMNVLVKEVMEEIETAGEGRKITWDKQPLPKVFGDGNLLKRVWANLLDNAVKYTGDQPAARISIDYKDEGKDYVFCVADNGVGFDMQYAHKLFGVFQRLHSQAEFVGTGIGLANVQRIIHKHMGRVWAEAEPGNGAKFYFSLPKYLEKKA